MSRIWKELNVSPEEQKLAEEIINSGAGKTLGQEALNQFHVRKEWNMEIETSVGKTLVHMYQDQPETKKSALFINVHGGGFIKGRRDQDIVFCRNFGSRSGCIIADIDYIPSPAMRYPGQVYACYEVLQYFAEHAEELHIDRNRIAMGGHSAGGNLTLVSVLMAIDRGTFVPALQILDYPGLDMATPAIKKRNGDSNPRIPAWKSDFYNKMYVNPEDSHEVYCSPAFATDAQIQKMPPTALIYCDNDVFCDETEVFAGRLLKAGVPVYARRFFHSNHGFTVQRKGEYEQAESMILHALAAMKSEN